MTENITVKVDGDGTATAGQTMRVEASLAKTGDAFLGLHDQGAYAYLSPAEARKLGEWFAVRCGIGGYTTAKVGAIVKVLSGDGSLKGTYEVSEARDSEYLLKDFGYVSATRVRHAAAILPGDETPATPPTPTFAQRTPV